MDWEFKPCNLHSSFSHVPLYILYYPFCPKLEHLSYWRYHYKCFFKQLLAFASEKMSALHHSIYLLKELIFSGHYDPFSFVEQPSFSITPNRASFILLYYQVMIYILPAPPQVGCDIVDRSVYMAKINRQSNMIL